MLPSIIATELRNCVADYLRTTFRPTTPGFDSLIDRFLATPENLYRGPYISIGLPFRPGSTGATYYRDLPMQFAPHLHQECALDRLSPPYYQSTIVATGTGSGKTECFLYPLLEHCRQQAGTPGIKAILIYPMNALATDQAKRIAKLIHDTPTLNGKIAAGLYVGDQDDNPSAIMQADKVITEKSILRSCPPDILLTNYKMLDYLLIQPDTQELWRDNQPETLRYIIVDEFHTFDGAQGTDLACLLRRLKHRLKTPPNHLACVGTSATLGGEDNRADMLDYARSIFQEPFSPDAIIEEDRLSPTEFLQDSLLNVLPIPGPEHLEQLQPDRYSTPQAYIRTQAHLWLHDFCPGLSHSVSLSPTEQTRLPLNVHNQQLTLTESTPSDPNAPLEDDWCVQLGEQLLTLPIIQILLRTIGHSPCSYPELFDQLGRRLHFPSPDLAYRHALLDSLFSLIAAARRQISLPNGDILIQPWVNLRSQLWLRELRRMVGTVSPEPELRFSSDLTPNQLRQTLPIIHCRDCGNTGWAGIKVAQDAPKLLPNNLQNFYREFFSQKPTVTYLFPTYADHPTAQKLCPECFHINPLKADRCQACNHDLLIPVTIPDQTRETTHQGQKRIVSHTDCPVCNSKNGLSILGAQAASITSAMIGVMFTTPYNSDKKLLTFSDSVQDAAHRAGFYTARTYRTTLRTAIAYSIRHAAPNLTLQELIDQFANYWRSQLGNDADFAATFLPNDLAWLREWDEYIHSDKTDLPADSRIIALINERLEWEVVNQFGHRSAVGPSLERSATCSVSFNRPRLEAAIADLHPILCNEVEALRNLTPETLEQFILGLLHHLRQRGGILQNATREYIRNGGNTFLWTRITFMPNIGPGMPTPIFFVDNRAKLENNRFERILKSDNTITWAEDWTQRVFSNTTLLLKDQIESILSPTLEALVSHQLLQVRDCNGGRAWGIPMDTLHLHNGGTVLVCDRCSHQITTAPQEEATLNGLKCLNKNCSGHYHINQRAELTYYRQLYRIGQVQRIIAAEHTGLLKRGDRERLEKQFIHHDRQCDPNLLSATSTLEMGINIGDLSSVILCSVPPTPANFQQRIGRAGRRNGNAFISTIANSANHDLYFYSDPNLMLNGAVDAAGCYLDAAAVLQRQLTAFCLDNWVDTGITLREFPRSLSKALDAIEPSKQVKGVPKSRDRFPYNWLSYIQLHQSELLTSFLGLFEQDIESHTREELQRFMELGEQNEGGLGYKILNQLDQVRQERTRLKNQIQLLNKRIKDLETAPAAVQNQDEIDEFKREKQGFQALFSDLNQKHILNFLTDEGLLPNYVFPETGVTLRSILWRQLVKSDRGNGKSYDTFTLTYERPGALAIRELVPNGVFYAQGRKVRIDQIDLKLSQPEDWRICRSCNYAVQNFEVEAHDKNCPRCGDGMWSDQGRVRRMLRLRQVMANTSDKDSRFGDDSEDRNTGFFQRHLLVDFKPEYRDQTFLVDDDDFPFGFEFISRTSLRELNLGESQANGDTVEISGRRFTTQGFRVCGSCGKVMRGNAKKDHTLTCQHRDKPDQAKALDVLYLYREFESESIRLLMPGEQFWTNQGLHSFVAALQLGLKQKFRGKVDHLHTVIGEEPQPNSKLRKSFLYLYDSVPGGTGYLRQLIRKPNELLDVFQKALERLVACDCDDGCYKCLFAYRGHFDQDQTSRRTAIDLLTVLISHWSKLKETTKPLSAIRLNSNFESELERRFIEAVSRYKGTIYQGVPPILRKDIVNGRPGYYLKIGQSAWTIELQVPLNQSDGVSIPSRADFIFRPASRQTNSLPIVLFTDGWEFHRDRISQDFQQRLSILRSQQFLCWSLTWTDITAQIDPEQPLILLDSLNQQLNPQFIQGSYQFNQQYECHNMSGFERYSSFEWLMAYLAQPDHQQWQRFGLMRSLAQVSPNSMGDSVIQQAWAKTIQAKIGQQVIDIWGMPDRFLCSEIAISAFAKVYYAVDSLRHRKCQPEGSLLLLELNDVSIETSTAHQQAWIEILRLLNLYQFLPHCYAITTTALQAGQEPPLATVTQSDRINIHDYHAEAWQAAYDLVDVSLLPAMKLMAAARWPIPDVGYDLSDDRGKVIATAELAWPSSQVAVVPTPEDLEIFHNHGWYTIEMNATLDLLDSIRERLNGGH
ncbi:MAG: RNA helicase [Alkalinema sp. CACIAM 70d]|nr:MAG: RNA helicase [Alkalinema sp. CACIAM 70d]